MNMGQELVEISQIEGDLDNIQDQIKFLKRLL